MPKKVVVKKSSASTPTVENCVNNICSALAEAIGSAVSVVNGTESGTKTYRVSFSSVGYSNLSFEIQNVSSGMSNTNVPVYIYDASSGNRIESAIMLFTQGKPYYSAMNCYVVRDSNNDTVLAHVHLGETEVSEFANSSNTYLSIFVGRDVNDGVLWGIGQTSIAAISNGANTINVKSNRDSHYDISVYGGPSDLLQFVKMRNYLADGYPEMKTAYVTVTRTVDPGDRGNISYYADGSLWGYGGCGCDFQRSTYEIDPWVKY